MINIHFTHDDDDDDDDDDADNDDGFYDLDYENGHGDEEGEAN